MAKLSEFITALNDEISAAAISGFWSETAKKYQINKAGERVANFHNWKDLELAQYIMTFDSREYYDYPVQFKPNSIYYLTIDGEPYEMKGSWREFEQERGNGVNKFVSHDGFYFLDPIPADGLEIVVWGNRQWVQLSKDSDEGILPSRFDEAVVKLAKAGCLKKEARFQEANSEIAEVETPMTPRVPNSGGILARLKDAEESGGKSGGYTGKMTSTRFQ